MSQNSKSSVTGSLEKAILEPEEGGSAIEFQFNPTELVFNQSVNLSYQEGARTRRGLPKVSFAYPQPATLTLSNVLFDTYEEGISVMKYIDKLKKSVAFTPALQRPPIYTFVWGKQQYLRCMVESLTYRLTLFLPKGEPVQARVDMTLKEVDEALPPIGP
jgi:hypothetical protein